MFNHLRYNDEIWKEIGASVKLKVSRFLARIQQEVASDRSLDQLPSKHQIIWQRADDWVQSLYQICSDVYTHLGGTISVDFDRVVWAYCIEPFILKEAQELSASNIDPGLLELLLCAIGSPPEKRNLLRVSEKSWCLNVRSHIYEAWQKKLLRLQTLTQFEEAAAAMSKYNTLQERARRIVAGLPTRQGQPPETYPVPHETPSSQPPASQSKGIITGPTPGPTPDSLDHEPPKEKYPPLPTKKFDYSNLMDPAHLTDLQRECYSLRHEYQLPVVEIARRLGRDRKTIQEHIDSAENKTKIAASKDRARKQASRFGRE